MIRNWAEDIRSKNEKYEPAGKDRIYFELLLVSYAARRFADGPFDPRRLSCDPGKQKDSVFACNCQSGH